MELEKLKEYLDMVVAMEKNIYVQQSMIAELSTKIHRLQSAIQDANRQSEKILESTRRMTELVRDFHGDVTQLSSKTSELH